MRIKCYKCEAKFEPKGLMFGSRCRCPECGFEIDFTNIRFIHICNTVLSVIIALPVVFWAEYLRFRVNCPGILAIILPIAGGFFVYSVISYPLTCFLYRRFSYEKLRRDGNTPDGRFQMLDRFVVYVVLALLAVVAVLFR